MLGEDLPGRAVDIFLDDWETWEIYEGEPMWPAKTEFHQVWCASRVLADA